MHIGLYLEHVHDNRLGGVGTYSRNLAECMVSAHPVIRLTFLAGTAADARWASAFAAAHPAAAIRVRRIYRSWRLDALLTRFAYLGFREDQQGGLWPFLCRIFNYVEWQCACLGLDLIYSPTQTLPLPYWTKPSLFTLHDVQELHLPENFTAGERASRAVYNLLLMRGTSGVVVCFDHVRRDMLKFFKVDSARMHLVPFPVQLQVDFSPAPPLSPPGVDGPFFMYPAQIWPHKNHATLLRAFARLGAKTLPAHLVFTGRPNPLSQELKILASNMGIADRVHWLGLVPDSELASLYRGCLAVVLPTRYEAGGYPLYEAIRHGVPAICSTATSLPEVMGNPEYVFAPGDEDRLLQLLESLLTDASFLEANRAHMQSRAPMLNEWAKACQQGLIELVEKFGAKN